MCAPALAQTASIPGLAARPVAPGVHIFCLAACTPYMQLIMCGGLSVRLLLAPPLAQAWFCLNRNHFPRKQCCLIVLNPWFDRLVLLAIAANCITMTVFMDPVLANIIDGPNGTQGNEWAESRWLLPVLSPTEGCTLESGICSPAQRVDAVFLFAFTIEMFLKMMAMGLVRHPNAYLRSGWNWLDLIVVVAGFLELLSTGRGGITTLRLAKMLRPLRSVQRVRGMRVIVQSILEAWSTLLNVMVNPSAERNPALGRCAGDGWPSLVRRCPPMPAAARR